MKGMNSYEHFLVLRDITFPIGRAIQWLLELIHWLCFHESWVKLSGIFASWSLNIAIIKNYFIVIDSLFCHNWCYQGYFYLMCIVKALYNDVPWLISWQLHLMMSHYYLEIDHSRKFYTTEIGMCYKSWFFPPEKN